MTGKYAAQICGTQCLLIRYVDSFEGFLPVLVDQIFASPAEVEEFLGFFGIDALEFASG